MWGFSAAVCINDKNEILMVQQKSEDGELKWTVPSGRKKIKESFMECCIRETYEETGYIVKIDKEIFDKEVLVDKKQAPVKYFTVTIIGGERQINDPDDLIYDVQWISESKLKNLKLSFPEDMQMLLKHFLVDSGQ